MRFTQLFRTNAGRYRNTGNGKGNSPLLSQLARVPAYREALPQLLAELARARRYHRPLSVLVMRHTERTNGGNNGNAGEHPDPNYVSLMMALLLGGLLPDRIRETDVICYDVAAGRYVILMPELTRAQADQAVRRLRDFVQMRVPAPPSVGVAEFPKDGLTLEEIIAAADGDGYINKNKTQAAAAL